MAKVSVPQKSGDITISTARDSKTFTVTDGVVTTNQEDAELLVREVDGASIEGAKK